MTDYVDLTLDWLDGILPSIFIFTNEQIRDLKNENSLKRKIITVTLYIVKALYMISSLYTLYHIKYVKKENYFVVKIGTKIITTSISLILIIGTIFKLFKKLL